jgi:pyruvate kinase
MQENAKYRMALVWGVIPIVIGEATNTDRIFEMCVEHAKAAGHIEDGDLVVITAGIPVGVSGATNLMKVHLVGEVIIKGTGLVKAMVRGRACIGSTAEEIENKFEDGDIIVATSTDRDLVPFMSRAAGVIVEEGGYTSHGAIVSLSLKKPCVVGVANATTQLTDGMEITLDSSKGIVYAGKSRVL